MYAKKAKGKNMWNNFIYSANIVLPLFVMVLLGYLFKRTRLLDESFFSQSEKFVFKVALPCMVFLEVANAGSAQTLNWRLVGFCSLGITANFITLCLLVPCIVRANDKRGAIIQGIYRSNFAVLGVPLATSMFGEAGGRAIAIVLPFVVVIFNVYAVIVLSIFAPRDARVPFQVLLVRTLKSIVTNPLIIGVVLALPFLITGWTMPTVLQRTTTYLSNTTFALSLMSLGSTMTLQAIRGKLRYSLSSTLVKTIAVPAVMICIGCLCGFRGPELGIILILFGTPSAVSSYIMAKNMKSDHELAGQILLLTTLLCLFTLFGGIFVLKTLGLI